MRGSKLALSIASFFLLQNLAFAKGEVFGGEEVKPEDPLKGHVAALLVEYQGKPEILCTTIVIDKDIVLTAAHCVDWTAGPFLLRFDTRADDSKTPLVTVKKFLVHPQYLGYAEKNANDVAVLHFEGGLPEGYLAIPIFLNRASLKSGQIVMPVGYGDSDNRPEKNIYGVLNKALIKLKDPNFSETEVTTDQSEGSGACAGDSGGPLMVEEEGQWKVLGITSGPASTPVNGDCDCDGRFTAVSAHAKWIDEAVAELRKTNVP